MSQYTLTEKEAELHDKLLNQYGTLLKENISKIARDAEKGMLDSKHNKHTIRYSVEIAQKEDEVQLNKPSMSWSSKTEILGNPTSIDLSGQELENDGQTLEDE